MSYESDDFLLKWGLIGLVATFAWSQLAQRFQFRNSENTNQEYVNPRNLKFIVEDKDSDGKPETYILHRGKRFLFKDIDRKPETFAYEFKEEEVNTYSAEISTKPYERGKR
ncbi:hypothetical protein ACFLZZ_01270 [Nanoarchaeota archaeon]